MSDSSSENYKSEDYPNRVIANVQSLIEISLECVLNNIDRFNTVFLSTENPCLRKNLLFLQRVYSQHFLKKLTSTQFREYSEVLDRKYYDFLINEHLKLLNTGIFHKKDWETAINRISKIGHAVDEVDFHYNTSADDFLEEPCDYLEQFVHQVLPFLPNVSTLLMGRTTKCNNDTLRIMRSSCKELKKLEIEQCPITGEGLKDLCSTNNCNGLELNWLALKYIQDCDDGVTFLLKNMPTLEVIAYDNLPNILYILHENDLRNNSLDSVQKYNLTTLHISIYTNLINNVTMFEDILSIAIVVCPYVSVLYVLDVTKPSHLRDISRFSNLCNVSISCDMLNEGTKLDSDEFLSVSGKKLKALDLENFKMSISVLIKNGTKLESVRLANIQYLPCDKKDNLGQSLTNLEKLKIESVETDCEVAENSVILLLDCTPNVEKLSFTNCTFEVGQNLFGAVERFCEKSTQLQELNFAHSTVDEALLHHIILTCTPLKKLAVDFCEYIDTYQIEKLRDVVKTCNSRIVIDCTSKSDLDSNEDDFDDELTDSWEDYGEELDDDWNDNFDEDDGDYYAYNIGYGFDS